MLYVRAHILPSNVSLTLAQLAGIFAWIASSPQASWSIVEIGIRYAQELGAHRRAIYAPESNINDELWKRAFWVLVILDRTASLYLGRPCAIQDEDLDVDLPLMVDDEYWESLPGTEDTARPPKKKWSTMEIFVYHIQLSRILAFALYTLVSQFDLPLAHNRD
jgi:hypothetical protein